MDTAQIRWSFTRAGALIDAAGTAEGVPRPDSALTGSDAALLGSLNGRVSVIWQVSDSAPPPNGGYPPATRVELASFDGARWTAPQAIIRGRGVHVERLPAMRPTRTLDVVAAIVSDSVWQAGVWTTPVAVSTHDSLTEPAAGIASGGHLMATWAEAEFSPLGIQPRSFASLWTAGCVH
jgi:hypothetical protein